MRTVRIIRDEYTVTDDGYGGSVDVDHDVTTEIIPCTGDPAPYFESAAREAVGHIRRAYLGTLEDAEWFGTPEPYADPYDNRQTATTAHLHGDWTVTERRAVARMVEWCENRDRRIADEYAARATY